jgi:hypothetical protein
MQGLKEGFTAIHEILTRSMFHISLVRMSQSARQCASGMTIGRYKRHLTGEFEAAIAAAEAILAEIGKSTH